MKNNDFNFLTYDLDWIVKSAKLKSTWKVLYMVFLFGLLIFLHFKEIPKTVEANWQGKLQSKLLSYWPYYKKCKNNL